VAVPGNGADEATRSDPPDLVVSEVGGVDVAGRVDGDPPRLRQVGDAGGTAVAAAGRSRAGDAAAGDKGDRAIRRILADLAVERVGV
jgi:hypothetical protein